MTVSGGSYVQSRMPTHLASFLPSILTSSEGAIVVVFQACIARGAVFGEDIKSRADSGNQAFSLDVAKVLRATWLRGSSEPVALGAMALDECRKA